MKTFDRLEVLRHFRLPKKLMVQVTGYSLSLIEESRSTSPLRTSTSQSPRRWPSTSRARGEYGRSGIDELTAILNTWERLVAANFVMVKLCRANAADAL